MHGYGKPCGCHSRSEGSPAIKWNSPSITHLLLRINDTVYEQTHTIPSIKMKTGNPSSNTRASQDRYCHIQTHKPEQTHMMHKCYRLCRQCDYEIHIQCADTGLVHIYSVIIIFLNSFFHAFGHTQTQSEKLSIDFT